MNLIKGGLEDVSVSRPNLAWGIPLPEEIEGGEGHTVYVWPDALLNYLSALGWPQRTYCKWWLAKEGETGGPGAARQDEFQELDGQGRPGAAWAGMGQPQYTNAFHLIGKDISRFHCVLWPAMLLAAGVPLPRQVYVHGFILLRKPAAKDAGDGEAQEKMSKSRGNVVDPVEMAARFGADALRFYLIDAIPTGGDGEFSLELFVEHCNTHLANKLGNLSSRTVKLVHNGYAGATPPEWAPDSFADPAVRGALDALIAAADGGRGRGAEGLRRAPPARRAGERLAGGRARQRVRGPRAALGPRQGPGAPRRAGHRAERPARDAAAGGHLGLAHDPREVRGAVGRAGPAGHARRAARRGGAAGLRSARGARRSGSR